MPSTIRDVARQAGVSIATVSRVMRESGDVRPDTRDRVRAAASELRYTPSQLGRQLAERRHAANGIVFPDLSGPYYAEVVLGYEAVAAELRRSVLILSTHGRERPEDAVREMAARCDGLVVLGRTVPDEVVEELAADGAKVVVVARPPITGSDDSGTDPGIDAVNAENRESAAALAHHLLDQGCRQIAFVGDPDASPDVKERWRGVAEVVTRERHRRLRAADRRRPPPRVGGRGRRRRGGPQPRAPGRLRVRQRRARARACSVSCSAPGSRSRTRSASPAGTTSWPPATPASPPSASRCASSGPPPPGCSTS